MVMSRKMNEDANTNIIFNQASTAWDNGNLKKAYEFFLKAAENGDQSSQTNLGYFYDEGIYVERNFNKALYWYKKAYQQGDGSAASNIAINYKLKNEFKKALWWFHKAVSLKDHDAFLEIGRLYESGLGVQKNTSKAICYYEQVINSGQYSTELTKEEAEELLMKLKT